jgi:hypothetical protein
MVLLDSAGGIAVEYLFQIVIASLLGIFVLWRLSVAAGGKTEGLHPFKRSFYSALLAEYYLNKAKKITPKKGSILDHLRIVDLCDKAISFFPLIGAYRLKIDSYFQLGINEETSQQERFKYLNQVAKTCNDLIETHPQSFHAYSTKAWYLLQSKGHKTPESFSYDVNEAFTLGKEALKHIEKDGAQL